MKKFVCAILAIILVCNITGCSRSREEDKNKNLLSQIYIVDTGNLAESEIDTNTIEDGNVDLGDVQYSIEKTVGEKETLRILNNELSLSYKETAFHRVGEFKLHKYNIDGSKEGYVQLNADGTFNAIVDYNIMKLDISFNEPKTSVLEKVKTTLGEMLNISEYGSLTIRYRDMTTYCKYVYDFWKEINGYPSEGLRISITSEDGGMVKTIRYVNPLPDVAKQDFQVSEDKEQEALQITLKDIYDTDKTEYLSHKRDKRRCKIAMYNGEVCIVYRLETSVVSIDTKEEQVYWSTVAIPLRLLTEN